MIANVFKSQILFSGEDYILFLSISVDSLSKFGIYINSDLSKQMSSKEFSKFQDKD